MLILYAFAAFSSQGIGAGGSERFASAAGDRSKIAMMSDRVTIPTEAFRRLVERPNIVAVKDIARDYENTAELMKIAFVMVLARYLRFRSNYRTVLGLLPPWLFLRFRKPSWKTPESEVTS